MNQNKSITKKLPLFIAAALMLTLCLGFAAPASAVGEICEIVNDEGVVLQQYSDFYDALLSVQDGETIRLLEDIRYYVNSMYEESIEIDRDITFDVNGFVLDIEINSGDALVVTGSLSLNDSAGGEFNVYSYSRGAGVRVDGRVTVTNVFGDDYGVYSTGGLVTVKGDVTSYGIGVYAEENANITVGGDVKGDVGVFAVYSIVTVDGNVAGNNKGVYADYSGTVMVSGDVTSDEIGVQADYSGTVIVGGDVTGDKIGVQAEEYANVVVGGDVTGDEIGVQIGEYANVMVDGNVTSNEIGVHARGGYYGFVGTVIVVGGNVTGDDTGVRADGDATIVVNGNVISDNAGVFLDYVNAKIIIDGTITINSLSGVYIEFYDGPKGEDEYEPSSTKSGYFEYTTGNSVVWVRDPTVNTYVCKIEETGKQFTDFETAQFIAKNGQTIKLLENIDCDTSLTISYKSITLDVNGFVLNLEVTSEIALRVDRNGELLLKDSAGGEFNVIGLSEIAVFNTGNSVTVSNAFGEQYGV